MAKPRLMKVRALFYIHRTCPGASPSSVVDWTLPQAPDIEVYHCLFCRCLRFMTLMVMAPAAVTAATAPIIHHAAL